MGHAEVQTSQGALVTCSSLATCTVTESAWFVPSLGSGREISGWIDGSPVSGDVHAGFCEKPKGQFLRLTHPYTAVRWLGIVSQAAENELEQSLQQHLRLAQIGGLEVL